MSDDRFSQTWVDQPRPVACGISPRRTATASSSDGVVAPRRGNPLVAPTRRPVHHTGQNFRGKFYSDKNARHIKCESYLEVLVARLLEFLRNVRGYSEQPPALFFRVGSSRPTSSFIDSAVATAS
jgi:hypothetical protein